MNFVFCKYISQFYYIYLDDIIFWLDSIEEHTKHFHLILGTLWEHRILASIKRSILYINAIAFLGHIISSRGIEVAEDKVDKIIALHEPTSA